MRLLKTTNLLFICIIFVTLIKLNLIGNGFLAFPDEWRHIAAGHVLKHLQSGEFKSALVTVFSTQGRPVDTIIKTIPNGFQYISAQILGLEYYESANSFPLFLFNFIVYCLILIVHYKFSKLILKDKTWILFSVLVLGCLANSYIYLRHGLPYDTSLLLLYFAFYKVLKTSENKNFNTSKALFFGFFTFFGYLAYPGYFLLFVIIGLVFFFNNLEKNELNKRIKLSLVYGIGSLICLVIFEGLSRIAGTSYLASSQELSGTLNQGSFEECFSFLIKYLFQVEKLTGIFILLGILFFAFLIIKNRKKLETIHLIFIITALIFIVFCGAGYFFQKVILSGRVLHQFFPLLVLFFVFACREFIPKENTKSIAIGVFSLLFIGNFGIQFWEYKDYSYPRDVSWEFYKKYHPKEITSVCEINKNSWDILPIESDILEKFADKKTNHIMKIVNSCSIYPFPGLENYSEYQPPKNEKLLFSKSSYLNFVAYKFEGYSIQDRENVGLANLKTKVYISE